MSMVTLHDLLRGSTIPLNKLFPFKVLPDWTHVVKPKSRNTFDDIDGTEITLQQFIDRFPDWANSYEWQLEEDGIHFLVLGCHKIEGEMKIPDLFSFDLRAWFYTLTAEEIDKVFEHWVRRKISDILR